MALSGSFSGSINSGHYRLRVDWSASQSVADNTSTITANMYLERDYALYIGARSDNSTNIDGTGLGYSSPAISSGSGGTTHLGTVSRTVSHNADGTKSLTISSVFNVRATISKVYYESISASATITLDTIPRTSGVSGGSGNIGGTSTINISRASSSFTHKLYFSFGNLSWNSIASNVGTSYTWTLPTSLYAQIPNANSGTGTIYCETYYNGTYIGTSSCGFTANVTNSNPTFSASNLSYLDSNTTIAGITGNNQHIVRNQSNLKVTYTSATAKNSASISKYEITLNGSTQTKTSATTIDYGKMNVSSDLTLSIKAIDSRGNSTTATKTIKILDWILPTAEIKLNRLNNYENTTYLTVIGSISSVNSKNSIQSIKYRYKKVDASSYSSQTSISNNTKYTLSFDKLYAWNMEIVIADKFGSTTYNLVLAKGMPVMFIDSKKLSVGINCFPNGSNSFEINGKTLFDILHPIGSIYKSTSSTNPSTYGGTWTLVSSDNERKFIGQQVLYNEIGGNGNVGVTKLIGAYDYGLIEGVFENITVPTGYHKEYRLIYQGQTGGDNRITMYLNNIATNQTGTWSSDTFRIIGATKFFKPSEITLETTMGYSRNGTNLKYKVEGNANTWNIRHPAIQGFIVSDEVYYTWKRTG